MFERLNCRHGLICLAFLAWTLATFHRFQNTPKTSQKKPEVFIVRQMPEVPKVPKVPEVPELPAAFRTAERVALLLGEGEPGFKPWWEEQLERRERVAQTCDRFIVTKHSATKFNEQHANYFCFNEHEVLLRVVKINKMRSCLLIKA